MTAFLTTTYLTHEVGEHWVASLHYWLVTQRTCVERKEVTVSLPIS